MIVVMLLFIVYGAFSCAPSVSQQEYERVKDKLSAVRSELESMQDTLAEAAVLKENNEELNRQYDVLQSKYDGFVKQYEELKSGHDSLQTAYEALTSEYKELSSKYDALLAEAEATVIEEDLEQAIFELINQDRTGNGIEELVWGIYLYKQARNNSRDMAANQQLQYSDYGSYQEIYRATGYTSAQKLAEDVFTIWKETRLYEQHFLNSSMVHGAVGVYKSDEIYNITYITDFYR